ncbi:MAG: hypothetical protein M1832_003005 [Thelocarpon impressellum]|nr:MAG: hypothetical protein M1832_003005 [Thelocarpon impressellum]
MASTHNSLLAHADERATRLAALRNLKRKQGDSAENATEETEASSFPLSGRNYDATTRGPKLGFDAPPTEGERTLELRAADLAAETAAQAAQAEAEAAKPLDLWKLRPKKPNWDLKRDLEAKMVRVNVRTDNAIARLVRQRVLEQQEKAREKGGEGAGGGPVDGDGAGAGMEGAALVEGVHLREREERDEVMADPDDDDGAD